MQKIIAGILGLVLVSGVAVVGARALYTTQATVAGVTVFASGAGLEVGPQGGTTLSSWVLTPIFTQEVYPGWSDSVNFDLKNTGTVDLNITGRITAHNGWDGTLASNVEILIAEAGNTSNNTGWHTLQDWWNGEVNFPLNPLADGDTETYTLMARVDSSVGNSIQGKSLSELTFRFTGTQVAP